MEEPEEPEDPELRNGSRAMIGMSQIGQLEDEPLSEPAPDPGGVLEVVVPEVVLEVVVPEVVLEVVVPEVVVPEVVVLGGV